LNINLLDRPSSLATLADFFLVGFTLEKLQSERVALLSEINAIWQNEFKNNENFTDFSEVDQLQLLMDNTIKVKPTKKNSASVARLEGLSRRLMFKFHIKRTKLV
jgi:hypothetical protein